MPSSVGAFRLQRTAECERLGRLALALLQAEPFGMKTSQIAAKLGVPGQHRALAQALSALHPHVFRVNPGSKREARYAHARWVDNISKWRGISANALLAR